MQQTQRKKVTWTLFVNIRKERENIEDERPKKWLEYKQINNRAIRLKEINLWEHMRAEEGHGDKTM